MTHLRIITNNAADRATITVANTAAGMGADKLKTDIKGEVCRVLSSTATITLDWASLETVGAVVIPASNLGPNSTIRVRAYLDATGTTLLGDSGVKFAAPGAILENWDFSQPLNVNYFADGTISLSVNYFTDGAIPIVACYLPEQVAARKVVIDIANPDSTFTDLARLVVGGYHAPAYTSAYGATVGTQDMTKNSRAASGDIKSDWGPRSSTMNFDLNWIASQDRERIRQLIARGVGKFMFISLLAEHPDPVLERDYSIYGKPMQPGGMAFAFYNIHSSQFQIEGF